MTTHRLRVSLCTPLFLFIAADAFAEEETDYEAPSQFEKAFYDEGKLNLNTSLYIRHRAVKDSTTGKYGLGPAGIRTRPVTWRLAIFQAITRTLLALISGATPTLNSGIPSVSRRSFTTTTIAASRASSARARGPT